MGYVDKTLIPGETVAYRGSLSALPYGWVAIPLVAAVGTAIAQLWIPAALCAGLALVVWTSVGIRRASAEFAVTNKRIVIKLGILQRRTTETMLSKVENIGVDQGVWGRIFDYGTITLTGTGGTREMFHNIAAPLEFRRQVQTQLARMDDERLDTARVAPVAPR